MKKHQKKIPQREFLLSILLFLFGAHFLPKLNYFIPLICISFYRLPFLACLWLSLFAGLTIDFFSFHSHFGTHALNYCLCTSFLYNKKIHFFKDHFSTATVLSLLFSLISSCIQLVLFKMLGQKIPPHFLGLHILYLSLIDSLYAFCFFSLPLILWNALPKKRKAFTLKRPK